MTAVRALQVQLISADIALEELVGSWLKGYGKRSGDARRALAEVVSDLRAQLRAMIAFLEKARDPCPHAG